MRVKEIRFKRRSIVESDGDMLDRMNLGESEGDQVTE